MKNNSILFGCVMILSLLTMQVAGDCPSMDATGDCRVDLSDFAVFAGQWLTEGNYILHVDSRGASDVNISSSTGHDGITSYTETLTVGTGISLTAPITAGDDALFTNWTGDVNSGDRTISFVMNADKTVLANYIPMPEDLIILPAGAFQMGDSVGDQFPDELPVHTVNLDSFAIGRFEITNAQYCDFLKSAYPSQLKVVDGIVYDSNDIGNSFPYCDISASSAYSQVAYANNTFSVQFKSGRDMSNDPMVGVSWYGAVAYCDWRSQREGMERCYDRSNWNCDFTKRGYRLPTEAEWEYAARGGLSGIRFPWGDSIMHSQANYYSDSSGIYDVSSTRGYHPAWNDGIFPYTSPVGSFLANGYGLFDMAGGVWEWCNDWSNSYSSASQTNPTGPAVGSSRVIRGGSWGTQGRRCRVSTRNYGTPDLRYSNFGFRLVLNID